MSKREIAVDRVFFSQADGYFCNFQKDRGYFRNFRKLRGYIWSFPTLINDSEKYLILRNHLPTEFDKPNNWLLRDQWSLYFWRWYGFVIMSLCV